MLIHRWIRRTEPWLKKYWFSAKMPDHTHGQLVKHMPKRITMLNISTLYPIPASLKRCWNIPKVRAKSLWSLKPAKWQLVLMAGPEASKFFGRRPKNLYVVTGFWLLASGSDAQFLLQSASSQLPVARSQQLSSQALESSSQYKLDKFKPVTDPCYH